MTPSCDNACTAGHVRSPPTSGVVLQQQYGGNPASPEPSGGCRRGCGPAGRPRGDKRRNVTLSHPVCAAFLEQSLAGFAGAGIRVALRRCGRDGIPPQGTGSRLAAPTGSLQVPLTLGVAMVTWWLPSLEPPGPAQQAPRHPWCRVKLLQHQLLGDAVWQLCRSP